MFGRRTVLLAAGVVLAITATANFAHTTSNVTPPTHASDTADTVTADTLKPLLCGGISLTSLVTGSGTVNGAPGAVNELILGSAIADTINADGGDDCVLAGGGVDVVFGGAGADVLLGGPDDDHLAGEAGNDSLYGGPDFDVCLGGSGTNQLSACEQTTLDAPIGLVSSPGAALADIFLSWTSSPSPLTGGYNIYRSTMPGSGYALINTVVGRTNTTYTDTPALVDGDYFYVVEAYVDGHTSIFSNEAARVVRVTTGDSQVKEDKPDTNEGIRVTFEVKDQLTKVARAFAQFDLSSISSTATVVTALLRTKIEPGGAPGISLIYEAQRAAASWGELTITWNNQPGVSGSAAVAATGTTGGVWNQWTVTTDVQEFVNGTTPNNGWRIRDQAEGSDSQEKTKCHSRENGFAGNSPQLRVFYSGPAAPSASVGGTAISSTTEAGILAGGKTITITLANETWVAAGPAFDAVRQDIINGLDSAQAEVTGWNAEVRDKQGVADVVRTSGTVVTITLDAQAAYEITANETITVTVPATAVTGASPIVAIPTFDVGAASAAVSGTITPSVTEAEIVAGGKTILVTLTNDTWDAIVGQDNAITTALINGIDSAQSEATGWDVVVKANLDFNDVTRTSDTVVTVTLGAEPGYIISADETITVTVPATAVASVGAIVATPTFSVTAAAISAAVSGTVTPTATESEVVAGAETIIITLTNETWVALGAAFDAVRQDIINGLDPAQSEATGWNAEVRDKQDVAGVVRTTETVVTITLDAQAAYASTANETITVTVPASSVVGVGAIVPTPTFDIVTSSPFATISGTVTPSATEGDVVAGGETIVITLTNDTWDATVGQDNAITTALISGIDSAQAEATGWDAVVRANMDFDDVTRTSATVVTVTLKAEVTYDITADETITVTVPASAVTSGTPLVATPTFDIATAVATVSGTAVPSADEPEIIAGSETIVITLTNDTWAGPGVAFDAQRQNIINGLDSAQSETTGWNTEVRDKQGVAGVVRTSDTVVTITLDAQAAYNPTASETITVTVPASAIASTGALTATPTFDVVANPESPAALVSSPGAAIADIDLSWTASPTSYTAGYNIYRSITSGSGYALVTSVVGRLNTTLTDAPPDADGDYFYVVEAYFNTLISDFSNEGARVVRVTTGDSQVKEDKPDTNEGSKDRVEVKAQTNNVARIFLQFDLSSIPSTATIDSAFLRTLIETPPAVSQTYEAQRAAAAWGELTITWNN